MIIQHKGDFNCSDYHCVLFEPVQLTISEKIKAYGDMPELIKGKGVGKISIPIIVIPNTDHTNNRIIPLEKRFGPQLPPDANQRKM